MGWESRKGTSRRYYTRSRRVDGRVVREYVGSGPIAEAAAALDAARRCERAEQRRIHKEELTGVKALDEMVGEVARLSDRLVEAELTRAGYHKHKGEWRRRRRGKAGNILRFISSRASGGGCDHVHGDY